MISQWVSGYSVYSENDYKRCVCDSWYPGDPDCLVIDQDACNNIVPESRMLSAVDMSAGISMGLAALQSP